MRRLFIRLARWWYSWLVPFGLLRCRECCQPIRTRAYHTVPTRNGWRVIAFCDPCGHAIYTGLQRLARERGES